MNAPQKRRVFERAPGLEYLLYLPAAYESGRSGSTWPLVLFLHGAGERGRALDRVKNHGLPTVLERGEPQPFIAISPQCPPNTWWTEITETLHALVEEVAREYRVDRTRIYLTGLSMGGFGVWQMAHEQPDRYAALAPVCGGGDPRWAPRLANMPTWIFHGELDDVVPIAHSERMVEALEAVGAPVGFTRYPDAKHDSWTRTYDDPALYDWLLHQRLGEPGLR